MDLVSNFQSHCVSSYVAKLVCYVSQLDMSKKCV